MIGPVPAFIAHATFWVLLVYGLARSDLTVKRSTVFLLLWFAGRVVLARVPYEPAHAMFPSHVAVLDIALVFMIFKGDVRLT